MKVYVQEMLSPKFKIWKRTIISGLGHVSITSLNEPNNCLNNQNVMINQINDNTFRNVMPHIVPKV
jgi:hypothetical protein